MKLFKIQLFFSLCTLLFTACNEETKTIDTGFSSPFAAISAIDGESTRSAKIDDTQKQIYLALGLRDNINEVFVSFQLNEGYTLVSPHNTEVWMDLSEPTSVTVSRKGEEISYEMTTTFIDPNFISPFESVISTFREEPKTATFDHVNRIISVPVTLYASEYPFVSLREVPLTLNMSDRYTLVSPSTAKITLDLSEEKNEIVTRNNETEEEVTYTVEAAINTLPIKDRTETFVYKRGVNLSYWIQDYNPTWTGYFTTNAAAQFKKYGFDHFRIPLDDYAIFTDNDFTWDPVWVAAIREMLEWCVDNKVRALLDRHIVRPMRPGDTQYKEEYLYSDPVARERFISSWQKIADEFGDLDPDYIAYELLNEPHDNTPDASAWSQLQDEIIGRIRIKEPERIFFTPSMGYQDYASVKYAKLQDNDPNIIISFHYYLPMLFTHCGLTNSVWSKYKGALQYPGRVIPTREDAAKNPDFVSYYEQFYSAERLKSELSIPATDGRMLGRKVHCGEFGCMNNRQDAAMRIEWFRDVVAAFEANDIPWTQWECVGGGFGFMADGNKDTILEILTGYTKE